jgi:MSHA biogenesis protein MshL
MNSSAAYAARNSFSVILVVMAVLGGCATPVMKGSPAHLQTKDEPAPVAGTIPAPVQFPVILPKPRPAAKAETYSVVVNNVRVQELLFALARDAKLNVDIHAGISGVVTLNAIDQTLPQLLSRIAKQTDIRWELDGPNLAVMPDSPFLRLYKVDYVNMDRLVSSTVGVSSQITTGGASGGGTGGNSSTTTVRNTSDNKFWDTLIKNIEEILRETDKILPAGAAPAPQAPAPAAQGAQAAGAPAQVLPVAQNPTFREAAAVIANKEAGVISIRATSRQHERILEFLDRILSNATRQVLIEATIVEVQLNNQYQQGIDWSLLRRGPAGISVTQSSAGSPAGVSTTMFTGSIADPNSRLGNFLSTIRLLESFGNVRVLSSPQISVLNNQTAILKVVDEVVYFNVQASQSAVGTTGAVLTTFNTTPQTTPVGFVMNVTPQIGDNDVILLNLRPSLTRIARFVPDPNPSLGAIQNLVPEVRRREMESLIKVNSGQTAVMGGLIQDSLNDVEDGIPGVNRTFAASIFSQRNLNNIKTELVVFLRPVVIKDSSVDGDYRAFRALLPDQDFMSRPNPAKPVTFP